MREIDVAHAGQTVPDAIEQLRGAIQKARREGDDALLVVHGFGASGVGGAIKAGVKAELPRLARQYGLRVYGFTDKDRLGRVENMDTRGLNQGSTLLIFRKAHLDRESRPDYRPNFRNLRSRVKVRRR